MSHKVDGYGEFELGCIIIFLPFFTDDLEAMDGDERAIDADECTLSSDDEDFDDEWNTMPGDADATEMDDGPLHVLPLYALLSTQQQMRIFEDPPAGARLCVIATNVAETSLTIPNIKYVVDCGKVKERKYDAGTGVSSFEVDWTSKASADQRAGRAGRTGPGHCYRLYSSAVFDNYFPRFSQPEIQRIPVDSVYLQMKSMNIDNIVNFPFPTQPDREQLAAAERLLIQLDALDPKSKRITDVGRQLCAFPVAPRLGKMMLVGARLGCLEQTMVLVATLSAGDPFISDVVHEDTEEMGDDEERAPDEKQRRKANLRSYGFIQKVRMSII